jgi:hypothetical protein
MARPEPDRQPHRHSFREVLVQNLGLFSPAALHRGRDFCTGGAALGSMMSSRTR